MPDYKLLEDIDLTDLPLANPDGHMVGYTHEAAQENFKLNILGWDEADGEPCVFFTHTVNGESFEDFALLYAFNGRAYFPMSLGIPGDNNASKVIVYLDRMII